MRRTGAAVVRGDALAVPLAPRSVNLVLTSPPYFGLRVYVDDGEPLVGQLGNETTPKVFVAQLWRMMAQLWDLVADDGSVIVNLGDKRCGYSGQKWGNGRSLGSSRGETWVPRTGPRSAPDVYDVPNKSLMGIPQRFVVGIVDGEGIPDGAPAASRWVWREDIIWSKPNGMSESVTDRCRQSHEYVFHFTKQDRYYADLNPIREAYAPGTKRRYEKGYGDRAEYAQHRASVRAIAEGTYQQNPLGKLPGSVWEIPTSGLQCPDYMVEDDRGWSMMSAEEVWHYAWRRVVRDRETDMIRVRPVDHYAAMAPEIARRLILAYSPPAICTSCGRGRRTVTEKTGNGRPRRDGSRRGDIGLPGYSNVARTAWQTDVAYEVTGEECGCSDVAASTRPAVVFDPFGGAGTTAMVARALGRYAVSMDLSMDYSRLASWRVWDSRHGERVVARTHAGNQMSLGLELEQIG